MTVKLSPIGNDGQLDNNGLPLSGGKIYWYLAGTSTPVTTYTDITGLVAQSNPVVLNSRGEPANPIWLTTGQAYKAILKDSTDAIIKTVDNITGINDVPTPVLDEWVLLSGTATYISTTQFSVAGNQTATLTTDRRLKIPISGGTCYGRISTATYSSGSGLTTVVIVPDSSPLDNSISAIYYGFFNPVYPSADNTQVNAQTKEGIQNQTYVYFDTTGASGVYAATTTPTTTSLVDGQRFSLKLNAIGSVTNTLNLNGLGAKPLKQFDKDGVFSNTVLKAGQVIDVQYSDDVVSGGGWIVLNPLVSALDDSLNLHKATNENVTGIKTFNPGAEPYGLNLCKAWANISCSNFDGTAPTNKGYSVTSNVCTVTETSHTKVVGAIVKVDVVSGGMPDGLYTVTGISGTTWSFSVTTANTSGDLKSLGFIRKGFNVASAVRTGPGEVVITFANNLSNTSYAVLMSAAGGMNNISGGSKTVSGFTTRLNDGVNSPGDKDDISILVYGAL